MNKADLVGAKAMAQAVLKATSKKNRHDSVVVAAAKPPTHRQHQTCITAAKRATRSSTRIYYNLTTSKVSTSSPQRCTQTHITIPH